MKISLNWLKNYIDIELSPEKTGEVLTDIGLELEGMEEHGHVKGGFEGLVIGYVKTCHRHPNADRLSVTTVDVGTGEDLHVVCGANNVAAGQKVIVATVGTTLYTQEGEAWTIKKGNIRGEVSEGMICSEDEIGLGDDHSGIVVLPEDAPVGVPFKDYYQIEKDVIFEIGLTPNRSDATNHLGVAKDLAAALKINYDHTGEVRVPSVKEFKVDNHDLPIEIVVENTEACPRYSGLTIKGVTVKESPDWLKTRIHSIGVRPINNIVDITNFILHELGQPLHAFDYDRIAGHKVIVKPLAQGTRFVSLDEVERTLAENDLMICDGVSYGMCIGGVFGGIGSGVTENTRNIFLESAHFNAQWIRRTSMRHNLRTDAAKVFEKGSDPNITVYALKRAALLIRELAGGEIASEVIDLYPNPVNPVKVEVRYDNLQRLIGMEIPRPDVKAILEALEMNVVTETPESFIVAVPTNKVDVVREADVIEEILRIFGFNKVPIPSRIRSTIALAPQPDPNTVRNMVAGYLSANGFSEMMALSLTESKYYKDRFPEEELVYINNTSNAHLDIMRPSMLFSGLEAIVHNQNRQQTRLRLFEFGKTYRRGEGKRFDEQSHLTLFLTGDRWKENWLVQKDQKPGYFTLKPLVHNILEQLGISGYQETAIKDDVFSYGMRYHRGEQVLVEFGKITSAPVKKMDIRGEVFYADFQWDSILKAHSRHQITFQELNKYPSVRRDLALVIDNSVKFDDIVAIARKVGKKWIRDINLFDVYENEEQLGKDKKSYAVSFVFEDPGKTLLDKEVDQVMTQLIQECETKLGAKIRR